jgi:hypothetical protein
MQTKAECVCEDKELIFRDEMGAERQALTREERGGKAQETTQVQC